jgi:hypothetical protein
LIADLPLNAHRGWGPQLCHDDKWVIRRIIGFGSLA